MLNLLRNLLIESLAGAHTSTADTMADPNNVSQYKYSAMSNLVLQADRRFVTRRTDEATGDPESLAGRINVRDMGGRAQVQDPDKKARTSRPDVERGDIREGADVLAREQRRKREREPELTAADALVEGLRYRPRTPATQQVYRILLTQTALKLYFCVKSVLPCVNLDGQVT